MTETNGAPDPRPQLSTALDQTQHQVDSDADAYTRLAGFVGRTVQAPEALLMPRRATRGSLSSNQNRS